MPSKDWTSVESDIIADHYVNEPQPIRAICLGAGLSGIAFTYKAKQVENLKFTLYDRNPDVAGTWWEARYPGCSSDVPGHCYTYTWQGNPNWSRVYVGAREIQEFYTGLAHKYGVYDYVKLRHRVDKAEWDNDRSVWKVTATNLETGETFIDEAEIFLNCGGNLSTWKWPDIKGLHDFKGPVVHPARWPEDLDLKDKRVAVIGMGASALQLVPTIQKEARKLVSFNRSPSWVAGEFVGDHAPQGRDTIYTEEQRRKFNEDPEYFYEFRKDFEHGMMVRFPVFYRNSATQKIAFENAAKSMRARLKNDPVLCEKLIPKFPVGCRRVTPGHGYLEALLEDNVEVETAHIAEVQEGGILTVDGTFHELDIIITATGYDTSYVPKFPIIGLNGVNLQDEWSRTHPEAYLSVMVPQIPNYFMVTGPNAPISNGSLIAAIEKELDYCLKVAKKIQREDIRYVVPTQEATAEFNQWKDTFMKGMTWSADCISWYKKGPDGALVGPWPGSCHHFLAIMENVRYEDLIVKYRSRNRFKYFGDGRSELEAKGLSLGSHLTQDP